MATPTPLNPPLTPGGPPQFDLNGVDAPNSLADLAASSAFPQMSWALQIPQIAHILRWAAQYGYDSNWIAGQIDKTDWYQTHGQAARAWADLSANDPAEAKARTDAQAVAIRNQANTLGVNLTQSQIQSLATQSLTNGWNGTELNNVIGGYLKTFRDPNTPGNIPATMGADGYLVDNATGRRAYYGPNGEPAGPLPFPGAASYKQSDGTTVYYTPGDFNFANAPGSSASSQRGDTGYTIDQMRADAANYLVPVSDGTLTTWAQQIAQGAADQQGFKAFLQQQALSLYPTFATQINAGLDMTTATDAYRQTAASTLEIDPNQINFSDPKWSKALQQVDPKTGAMSAMPLWQWKQTLMSDPTYNYQATSQARNQAATVAQLIGRTFGSTTGGTTGGI